MRSYPPTRYDKKICILPDNRPLVERLANKGHAVAKLMVNNIKPVIDIFHGTNNTKIQFPSYAVYHIKVLRKSMTQ